MMIDVLNLYLKKSAEEIQFRLGYKNLLKINNEWIESDNDNLSLSEWEDLKELCLNPEEKLILETKGSLRGSLTENGQTWFFSFVEWRNNLKAYFSLNYQASSISFIQNPAYWDSLSKDYGIHIISGTRQSGKSTLIYDFLSHLNTNSPKQVVIHSDPSVLTVKSDERFFVLGNESLAWETNHPIYDGMDVVVCDYNDVLNWKKWVQFAEQGKKVFISLSSSEIEDVFLQVKSQMNEDLSLWHRFSKQLKTIILQKKIDKKIGSIHEILVSNTRSSDHIKNINSFDLKNLVKENCYIYQSVNQSLIQALIKRRIDVKTAFANTNDPDDLDQLLKKMGL